ncbi:MAG: hypothetical protein M3O26_05845 [Pseudomonadota bacterium]|nr:hypothetical protein [Pseudomonadota bacterium]
MQFIKSRAFKFVVGRPIIVAIGAALSVLSVSQSPIAAAQTAQAFPQTVVQFTVLGQTTIHGGPTSSPGIALPEVSPLDDLLVGLKNQSVRGGAAPAAPSVLASNLNGKHGLAIPSKLAGRDGAARVDEAGHANEGQNSFSTTLPPPPTGVPNPRGSPVVDSSSRVFHFDGLTHLDQRLAGTGIYTNTQFSLEPPDQALCVGGGFVVEAVNNAIAIYDKSGNLLTGPEALSEFWGLAPEVIRGTKPVYGPFISDPKCAYDSKTQRWFISQLMQDNGTGGSGRNFNLIAVSQTSDPRGAFLRLRYDVTDDGGNGTPNHTGCPCFGDQPLLGYDTYGVYQSTNEYGATVFNGAQIYAIPKKALVAAANGDFSHLYVVSIDASQALVPFGGLSYSVQPAVSFSNENQEDDSNRGVEFFLSALQFGNPGYEVLDNRIAIWALGNTSSLDTSSPTLSLSFDVIASETYGQPNPARQKPGPTPLAKILGEPEELINTNDDRMNQVVYANGLLYSGVNTIIGDGSRTGIAWFGVKPRFENGSVSGRVARQGYVAVDGNNAIFPSSAFTDETGAMVFTLVGPDYYPSAAYTRMEEDGTSAVHIAADGAAPDDGFTGYKAYGGNGVGRWGDYSAAVSDGASVWLATEYIPNKPRTVLANWGTSIIQIQPQ